MSLLSERNWDDEFEEIVDHPDQNPHRVYSEEEVEWLGPAVAEGESIREVFEAYREYKRDMGEMED
jgi:hypothetical protein